MTVALAGYPLSLDFRRRLEAELGEVPTYLYLPELRRRSRRDLARALTTLGSTWVIPLEDAASYPLRPILETVATVSRASRVEVIHSDLRRERVSRWRVAASLATLLRASVQGQIALRQCKKELDRLLVEPRVRQKQPVSDRIVHVNGNLWFGVRAGGSVGHIAGVLNGFVRMGLAVEHVSPSPPPMTLPGVELCPCEPPESFGLPIEVNYYTFQKQMVRALRRHLADPPRFLYQRMSVGNYAGVVAARRAGIPLVIEYNGSEVWAAKHWGTALRYADVARAAEDVCLQHAALVVTVSEVLRDELLERGVEAERIVWYPNCVDPEVFDPARFTAADRRALRASLGIPTDAIVVAFVGTFGAWHGADVLARAIVRLVDDDVEWLRALPVRFLFVGDGVRMSVVRDLLDREPYREFVTLAGLVPQEEAPRHLAASDVLVSPHVPNSDGSRFFGSPTKLFEYMAMGKPIVASDLDQIGDVLRPALRADALPDADPTGGEEEAAVLVRPGDEDQLVRGIRFVLERPAWRSPLGMNARLRVLSRYTWQDHVRHILDGLGRVSA